MSFFLSDNTFVMQEGGKTRHTPACLSEASSL